MSSPTKYRYKGQAISIPKAAELAGVSESTINRRLRENGGDMELAILAGNQSPIKLPEYEPDVRRGKPKQISPAVSRQIRIINRMLEALEDGLRLKYDDIAVKANVECLKEDLMRMRERLHG